MHHPKSMGPLSDSRNTPRARVVSGALDTTCTPRTRQGTKLRDVLRFDKPKLSYADFHHELTRNPDFALAKYVDSQESQVSEKKKIKEEEVVRHMSNLPGYLEKGRKDQEKALNVGVLDWKHLEKWKYSKKQMPPKQSGHSPTSSNTSLFSTDMSSTHSNRGQNLSPARQRSQRASLKSPIEASSKDHVEDARSSFRNIQKFQGHMPRSHPHKEYSGGGIAPEIEVFGGNSQKFRDSTVSIGEHLSRQHEAFGGVSKSGRKFIPDKYEVSATWKGKKKIQDVESTKETGRLRECIKFNAADQGTRSGREKPGTRSGREKPGTRFGFTGPTIITPNDRLSVEPAEKCLLARNSLEGQCPSTNDIRNQGVKNSSHSSRITLQPSSKILHSPHSNNKIIPPVEALLPSFSARMFSSPSRNRHTPEKKPISEMRKETAVNPDTKARNPSPIRRLSSAMGKMIRNAGSRDSSPLHRSGGKDCTSQSGSDRTDSSLFIDNPSSNNRGRSSPLRRLLDPILKPRVSNCSESSNNYSSVVSTPKPSNKSLESCATSVSDAHHNPKNGSSTLQALLQVSFKNGLPLFTFAIDKESNILAATVRKSSVPGKGRHNWIYTFFVIHEVKRKSGNWLNTGGKSGNHSYFPNVVAQMKVSESCSSSSIKQENDNDLISREYDLFAVDVGQGDENSTDFHPTNEFAAIIVKLPRITTRNNSKDDDSCYDWLDLSPGFLRENSQVNLTITVVLPGGLHTVPSKGEISRLAQRWRSGGLCDCGGWDLGCQLRVYETKVDSNGIHQMKDKLQLFSQVGQDSHPVLSLSPFKERIYSVEFSSSFTLLQAFATSVSFIDCGRPPELSEPNNVPEKVTSEVGVFELPTQSKISNQAQAPKRYVSYPPHSPVGRV